MITTSKFMAASEAADGVINNEMARVSDTSHPTTTAVAAPDPTLIKLYYFCCAF